jgi:hypothetical protein
MMKANRDEIRERIQVATSRPAFPARAFSTAIFGQKVAKMSGFAGKTVRQTDNLPKSSLPPSVSGGLLNPLRKCIPPIFGQPDISLIYSKT